MKSAFRARLLFLLMLSGAMVAHAQSVQPGPLSEAQLEHDTARIAAVQVDGGWIWGHPIDPNNDPADEAARYIATAAEKGADLVLFPELYLGMFRVPSPQTEKVAAVAREHAINVGIGCFEVTDEAGNYGNSYLLFDRQGEVVGRYFKAFQAVGGPPYLWPPNPGDPEWMMQPGQEFPVFDLDFGRVGILTCYDGYFPEIFRILSLKGAEIILWPNARGGEVEDYMVRSCVTRNYVHVATVNKAMGGGSMIAAWPNKILDMSVEGQEDFVIGTLDLARLREARINAREFHQRRAAIFKELAEDFKPWEYYGVTNPVGLDVPPPSRERHEEILRGAGVPFESPDAGADAAE